MRIRIVSLMVDDQEKALRFYTEILGFLKKTEVPVGDFKWLTVVSPDDPNGVELVIEPNAFPPAKIYQKALKDAGIPATSFAVGNVHQEYDRLTKLGVVFAQPPTAMGPVTMAVFDDTCGNLIQIAHK